MFCSKCGAKNVEGAEACVACGVALASGNAANSFNAARGIAKEQVTEAVDASWATLKVLGLDPVGGLLKAYNSLGDQRAVGVGVAFGLIAAVCFVIVVAFSNVLRNFGADPESFGEYLKLLIIGATPFAALAISCFIGQKVGSGSGGVASNLFMSGVALLPFAVLCLCASILGAGNIEILVVLFVIALCLQVMILFAGLTRIGGVTEKAASYLVPTMLIITGWLTKTILVAIFD